MASGSPRGGACENYSDTLRAADRSPATTRAYLSDAKAFVDLGPAA